MTLGSNLAYDAMATITDVKSFIVQARGNKKFISRKVDYH
jgi:hypothetical protein